jgi:hypothetical protein
VFNLQPIDFRESVFFTKGLLDLIFFQHSHATSQEEGENYCRKVKSSLPINCKTDS